MSKTNKLSGRNPSSLVVTLLVASLAVLYTLFVFLPAQRKTTALKQKRIELQQYIAKQAMIAATIEQANQRHTQVLHTTAAWQEHAPDQTELGRTLSSITQHAQQAEVILQRFDPQPKQSLKTLVQQPIAVSLEGSFAQVFDFLQRIETLPHRVWITNLSLTVSSEDGETLRAEMTLTIFADLAENSESAKSA